MKQFIACVCWLMMAAAAPGQDAPAKPKAALFPLGGDSPAALRDRIGFAIREKLDRDGAYEPLDGPMMQDMASMATQPVSFDSADSEIEDMARDSGAVVLMWGDCSPAGGKDHLRLKTLDLRAKTPEAVVFEADIADGGQIRDVVEKFLVRLPGVKPFVRPNEEAVHHDRESDRLFAINPNLLVNGDFAVSGHWTALHLQDTYPVTISDNLPEEDRMVIFRLAAEGGAPARNVLAMEMDHNLAENNGLGALSDAIGISPGVRYRLSFQYRSDGPHLQCFVKGYTLGREIAGQAADREVYRLQVPPGGATGNKWQTVEADVNPRNPDFPVQRLRVDLFIYLDPGTVMFADVKLKAVGHMDGQAATGP